MSLIQVFRKRFPNTESALPQKKNINLMRDANFSFPDLLRNLEEITIHFQCFEVLEANKVFDVAVACSSVF